MSLKVAVLGASGNIGSAIAAELSSREKYEVIGLARNAEKIPKLPRVSAVPGDVNAEDISEKIKGVDVVVSSIDFSILAEKLVQTAKQAGAKRLIVVGGAASLRVSDDGPILFDTPEFPKEYVEIAKPGLAFLDYLRTVNDYDWTFISPPLEIGPGERTGKYRVGKDVLLSDADGNSNISYADYAIALVDEIEKKEHIKSRFTVAY